MGKHGVNIANFTLGRKSAGTEAIALLYLDAPIDGSIVRELEASKLFQQVKPLAFDVA